MDLSLSSKLLIDSCRRVFLDAGLYAERCIEECLEPVILDKASSTMSVALGCSGSCSVLAFEQAAGRGRRGRVWLSPRGGVWLTVKAWRGWWSPLGLPVALGAAVAEALEGLTGVRVMVKWPNDLVVEGFKVGGILVEELGDWVLVGVGVDYANEPPVEGAASLLDYAGVLPDGFLAAGLLAAVAARTVRLGRRAPLLPRRLDYLAGRRVVVETEEGLVAGEALGVDRLGRLVLLADSGARLRLTCCSVAWAEGLRYKQPP